MATKEVKVRKTKEEKRKEAFARDQISHKRSADDQLKKLNLEKRRALKERTRLAKALGVSLKDTYSYDFGGSKNCCSNCIN